MDLVPELYGLVGCSSGSETGSPFYTWLKQIPTTYISVLRIRFLDPVLLWHQDPDPGMGNKSGSGSGILDEHPRSYSDSLEIIFWEVKNSKILWFGSGSGMDKFGSRIRNVFFNYFKHIIFMWHLWACLHIFLRGSRRSDLVSIFKI